MKNKFSLFLLVTTLVMVSCHKDGATKYNFPANLHELPLNGAKVGYDGTVYNHEQYGKVLYQHIKYYLGTVDPYSYLPTEMKDGFKKNFEAYQAKVKGWSHDQIIDDLVQQKAYTPQQGVILKRDCNDLKDFLLSSHPKQEDAWNWCLAKEQQVIDNRQLSRDEKEQLLAQKTAVRYALKWDIEQYEFNQDTTNSARNSTVTLRDNCDFWSKVSCWVGAISGLSGIGSASGGGIALAQKVSADALGKTSAIGAIIGVGIGIIYAGVSCNNCVNKSICDAPITVSFPYECYTQGNPLICTAVGSDLPDQFTFNFSKNNDLNDQLWSNFTTNKYIWLPQSVMSQQQPYSIAAQVDAHCPSSGGQPQSVINSAKFGWFVLSDLGKPFFSISGNSNISVNDVSYNQYYQVFGVIYDTNASIQWEIMPSGYPGYSATGSFTGGSNYQTIGVHWDNHPGFATLKCTATTQCATIVNYYWVHIY